MNEPPCLTRLLLAIPGAKAAQAQAGPPVLSQHFDAVKQAEWLVGHTDMARNGSAYRFLIFERDRGTAGDIIGHADLHNVTRGICQWAVHGYSLSYEFKRRGIMHEACEAVIGFAFDTLKLHRLAADYQTRNERSAAVLRRLGFEIEGTAKAYTYIAGAWRDHVLTPRLNPTPIVPA